MEPTNENSHKTSHKPSCLKAFPALAVAELAGPCQAAPPSHLFCQGWEFITCQELKPWHPRVQGKERAGSRSPAEMFSFLHSAPS